MPHAVFMRAVNLGSKTLRPARLAQDLAKLDVVNIGAAGTFAVRGKIAQAALRREIARRLPFETDLMIVAAKAVGQLIERDPLGKRPAGTRAFVTVLLRRPKRVAGLPVVRPEKGRWEVKVAAVEGVFALSLRRNVQGRFYPNEIVEKHFGIPATTRTWDTLLKVHAALEAGR